MDKKSIIDRISKSINSEGSDVNLLDLKRYAESTSSKFTIKEVDDNTYVCQCTDDDFDNENCVKWNDSFENLKDQDEEIIDMIDFLLK